MKAVIIVLVALLVLLLLILATLLVRMLVRSYQKYSGLSEQRGGAKQARESGSDRLKSAERDLAETQRLLSLRGQTSTAQEFEPLRLHLSTLSDQLRHATYGYSPVGASNRVAEPELAELQAQDLRLMSESDSIARMARSIRDDTVRGKEADLSGIASSLDDLRDAFERRHRL